MAYVYAHQRKDNGKCFYIGKGVGDRAFDTQKRNEHWERTARKYGFNTVILVDNISDEKALELEKSFIEQIGLENLTNIQEGGQGGWSHLTKKSIQKRSKTLSERKRGDRECTLHMQTSAAQSNRAKALSKAKKGKLCKNVFSMHTDEIKEKAYSNRKKNTYVDNTGFTGTLREMKERYPGVDIQTRVNRGTPKIRGEYKGLTIKIKRI